MEIQTGSLTNPNWVQIRRYLHRNPEVSESEELTAKTIQNILQSWGISDFKMGVGGHGILLTIEGELPGPTILFRAELDALPIPEQNDFEYTSMNNNVSHVCGHDGHMTILLRTIHKFHSNPPSRGKVYFAFQPAEENGVGARAILKDDQFDLKPDYVFALHNIPGKSKNLVLVKNGTFTPAVKSLIADIDGKTAHAAEPENGFNPAYALPEIVDTMQSLENRDRNSQEFSLITPVYINVGTTDYGISAGKASVHVTMRTWTQESLLSLEKEFKDEVNQICNSHDLVVSWSELQEFDANENDETAVDFIRSAAQELNLELEEMNHPVSWGEDFGYFTQKFKGAMFGLGAGQSTPALHNPDYDFPDELIETGSDIFENIGRQILNT